jgi:steroid 5-alpha reductase family enzyme
VAIVTAMMLLLWVVLLTIRNAAIVDVAWATREKTATCNSARNGNRACLSDFSSSSNFRPDSIVILSLPLLLACLDTRAPLGMFEKCGAAIWLPDMLREATAYAQLKSFKKNPANKGKTCCLRLSKYSRHPNYFFESTISEGYAVFALAFPWGRLALIAPALMAEYRRYQRTTGAFIPWFPRKEHA